MGSLSAPHKGGHPRNEARLNRQPISCAEVQSIGVSDDDLKNLFVTHSTEIRRHFDVAVERMDKRFDLLSEAVTQLDRKLDRTADRLDEKIERTAAETQAMIKFSHAELDRRVRNLEENQRLLQDMVTNLTARIERIENSTH